MSDENKVYDVIIVGCGPAGIAAGIEFEKTNLNMNYLILEGRNRIGGRAYTDVTTFGENIPVDLGAHYLCHQDEDNFLHSHYIPSDKDFIESDLYDKTTMKIVDENGNEINEELISEANQYVEDLLLTIKQYSDREKCDISIEDLIRSHLENITNEKMKNLVKMLLSYIELQEGSDLNQLSTKCYGRGEGEFQPIDLSLHTGLGQLVQNIASKYNLPIQLNSIVTHIDILTNNKNKLVRITTNTNESYVCKYVLITVPLGCLKSKTIQFNPSLPQSKETAIVNMGFGLLNKIYLQFSERFWEENLRRLSVVHPRFKFYFCLPKYHMLALYLSGYAAKQLEQQTDEQIIEEILNSLRLIYSNVTYPLKWLITRWNQDPFTKGSYSSFHSGNDVQTLKDLAEETHDGHAHWAGEHTNFGGCIGYVDSGFESGIREAKKITKKLCP